MCWPLWHVKLMTLDDLKQGPNMQEPMRKAVLGEINWRVDWESVNESIV